jgi:hypothetical protein
VKQPPQIVTHSCIKRQLLSTCLCQLCEVLPRQLIYDRDMVKDSADEFQFHRMGMVKDRRGKGHLFLISLAHFLVAFFFVLPVISVDYNSFITM